MTPELEKYARQKFKDWASRVIKFVDLNAPDVIIAHAIVNLFHVAISYIGKPVLDEHDKWLLSKARQSAALCQQCDNEIHPRKSHPPICGKCEGKEMAEYLDWEMELPKDKEDQP